MSAPQPPGVPDHPLAAGDIPEARHEAPPQDADPGDESPSTWQPVLWLKVGILLILAAYVIAFIAENRQQISVHFVFGTADVRLIWAILLLLGVGLVGGLLLSQLYRHRRRAKLAKKGGKTSDARGDVGG